MSPSFRGGPLSTIGLFVVHLHHFLISLIGERIFGRANYKLHAA